ncbi:MAG: hypothetical protein LUE61_02440 [Clostridiales bacterium]|nr:hypothetical protein [Clostridiales bacterium]
MMEYEKLPPALQQWCDQAASRAAEGEQYQVRREVSEGAYRYYTDFCAHNDPEQAVALTLHELGSPYKAARQREGKNARGFLITAIVAAALVALWDVVFALMLQRWQVMVGPQGATVAVGMVIAHVAVIALIISAVSYYRKVRRKG